VVAGCSVDQLPDDVAVPGVPGCLLDHVDEHPPHRHGVAEPRCPGGVEVDVGDDLIGRGPGPTIERNDVIGGLVRLDPQVSVLVVFIERERSVSRPKVWQNQPYSTDARFLTRPSRLVPDGVIGRRRSASSSPSSFHRITSGADQDWYADSPSRCQ
jgi:hypothetical protein